ncbi:acyltransferase family protein [Herbaspirillum sp. B65]|uniref:acyltransferase family protein n=1 Tax=Herbaspirillum sp. B65 TaxID=137708 RepID=UPI000347B0A0|nr:acyltransferase [Herbaspirillum sp. B65]
MHPKKLEWLQALRGIAALLVVFVHARYYLLNTSMQTTAESIFRPGAMGVDLFFLISGFIMTLTTANSDGTLTNSVIFWIKRLSRIWPVYIVLAILGIQALNPIDIFIHKDIWKSLVESLLFLPVDPRQPLYYGLPYPLGWTLNFEIYFYLVFGISMLFGRWRWAAFFSWLILSLIVFPMALKGASTLNVLHDYRFRIAYVNQITNPIIWTFAAGVIGGLLYLSRLRIKDCLVARCIVPIAVATCLWWAYSGLADFHGIDGWGGPLCIAFIIIALYSKSVVISVPKPLLWLGKVSFSLYLVHLIAQSLVTRILQSVGRTDLTQTWSHIFLTTILALAMAAISHAVLEEKLSESTKNWLLRHVGGRGQTG